MTALTGAPPLSDFINGFVYIGLNLIRRVLRSHGMDFGNDSVKTRLPVVKRHNFNGNVFMLLYRNGLRGPEYAVFIYGIDYL